VDQNGQSALVIWDRLEVYGYTVSDDRADVGSNVDYRWQLRYDYDDVVFDNSKGSVTIGGSAATWDSGNNRWYRTVTLPSTPQSYAQSLGFTDSAYGLTAITGTTSQSVIADRLELWYVGFDDSRINVGATVEVRFKVRYDYDDVAFDSGKGTLNIEGSAATWDSGNGWWKRSITQSSSVGSNLYDYNDLTFTDSTYGLTAKTGTSSNSVVTDRIRIDSLGTTDGRIDVSTQGLWYATASLEYDSHILGSGDSLILGGYTFSWVAGNSRFEASDTKSSVQAVTINSFTSGSEATYGITAGNINSKSQAIVWDRFEFVSVTVDDSRINVGGTFELRYQIRYDYDDVTFDSSKGSISGFTWDAANSWWDKTVTGSSSVTSTNYDETYISVSDTTYGLTAKQNVDGVNVVTDRIKILSLGLTDSRINANGADTSTLYATAALEYDSHALGSGDSLTIGGISLSWVSGNGRFEGTTASSSSVTSTTYNSFTSGNEATYGITAGNINSQSATLVYDKVKVISYSRSDDRANINDNVNIDVTLKYEFDLTTVTDGTITINGFSATHQGSGVWRITKTSASVTSVTYNTVAASGNTYGISTVNQNSQSISVIWDRLQVQSYSVSDARANVNDNVNIDALVWFDYDDAPCTTATITINGYSATHQGSGVYRITRTSSSVTSITYDAVVCSSETTYGITIIDQNGKSASVIWDKVRIYYEVLDDSRVDINSGIEFRVKGLLLYDGHVLGSGDTVTANFGSLDWDPANGWFDGSKSQGTVSSYSFQVSSLSEATYGITAFEVNATDPTGIWDEIVVYWEQLNDSRVNVDSSIEWRVKAVLDWDNHEVGLGDSLSCAWGTLTWNASNSYWKISHLESSVTGVTIGTWIGSEATYGITAISENITETTGVYDRIKIYYEQLDDSRVNLGDNIEYRVKVILEYDSHALSSGDSLTANFGSLSWDAVNSWFKGTKSLETVGDYTFQVISGNEATYGITVAVTNQTNPKGVWDNIVVSDKGATNLRTNINEYAQYWFTLRSQYDSAPVESGTATLNGSLSASWIASRSRWEYNVTKSSAQKLSLYPASANWDVYGITSLSSQSANYTSIIWDGLKVDSYSVDMSAVKVYVHMKYAYDSLEVEGGEISLIGLSATTNSTGWAEFNVASASDFTWGQKAYGIQDATYAITYKSQNQTLPIAKKTRLIQSDAEVSSQSWDGTELTVSFASTGSWTLKVSGPRPVYVINATYDLSTDYTTYLTLTHDGSKQIVVSYPGWGNFYVQSLSQGCLNDIYWTRTKLTIVLNGTAHISGTLTVYCGDRGAPQAFEGFSTTPEYNTITKLLTGQYTFASELTITLDFTIPKTGGGETSSSAVTLWVASDFTGQPGITVNALLNLNWQGLNSLTVSDIQFSGALAKWFVIAETIPKVLTKPIGEKEGSGTVQIQVLIPADAHLGNYTVPVTVDAEALGALLTTSGWITFNIQPPASSSTSIEIMNTMTIIFIAILSILIAYAYKRR